MTCQALAISLRCSTADFTSGGTVQLTSAGILLSLESFGCCAWDLKDSNRATVLPNEKWSGVTGPAFKRLTSWTGGERGLAEQESDLTLNRTENGANTK